MKKSELKSNNHKAENPTALKTNDSDIKRDIAQTYNAFKQFEGKVYTGMAIGRGHRWNYDQGEWHEKKVTPDKWQFSYAVKKHRKGHAPEGSGVPVGTEYHWYILAHQMVRKLDANTYTTSMSGLKYKLAHKRADKDRWSASEAAQRKHLVAILEELAAAFKKTEKEKVPSLRKKDLEPAVAL